VGLIVLGILGGFVALIFGGELLVRGATGLAAAAKVSPLVIGLTVVAFGTSAPELAVSIQSCYADSTELAVGNAVGSNIANILFILGLSAIVAALSVQYQLFRFDIPVMIATAGLLWLLGLDGKITWPEGIVFLLLLLTYFWWTVTSGRREGKRLEAELEGITPVPSLGGRWSIVLDLVFLVLGLATLVQGSDWLVDACIELAKMLGVSDLVIGLTVVAIGTSLPELMTSVMAAMRGKRDLAVGNVVGSNILNILGVLGVSAMVAPHGIEVGQQSLTFDIPVMVIVSLACLPIFWVGREISRGEGASLLVYYGAYLAWQVHCATRGEPPTVNETIAFVVAMLIVVGLSQWRGKQLDRI
jgi:cation:H+ antiporter